jgi:hypothetical protein
MHEQVTLLAPAPAGSVPGASSGLPPDLLTPSAGRLGIVAVMYICVFFLAGIWRARLASPIQSG